MGLSYNKFRKQYLPQAEVLCRNIGRFDLAEKLCKAGFEAVISNPDCFSNHRDIYVELAKIVYPWSPSVELLAQRIYPKMEIPLDEELISFDECIEKLLPVLKSFRLYDRIITSLTLLGWKNSEIAQLLNELIDNFSKKITSAITLTEVDEVLKSFVKTLLDKVLYYHNISDWFPQLMEYKNNPMSDYETWQFLEELCYMPKNLRFARKNNPQKDKFAKLRDRYTPCKKEIHVYLKETDFLKSDEDR